MPIEQEFQALLAKAAADIGDDSCTVRFRALAEEMADLKRNEKNIEAHHTGSKTVLPHQASTGDHEEQCVHYYSMGRLHDSAACGLGEDPVCRRDPCLPAWWD